MYISSRVKSASKSATLEINDRVKQLLKEGRSLYNLTSGQLPFRPNPALVSEIHNQTNFLASFQYSPIKGFSEYREKVLKSFQAKRNLKDIVMKDLDAVICNGSKHAIYNALGTILDPGDEVILFTPYWVSFPEMVQFWGGVVCKVATSSYDAFVPEIEDLEKLMTNKTRAIIINSPNNPAGIHYSAEWMKKFAEFIKKYPQIWLLSDEVYEDICYFDPKPKYFYEFNPELLKQTIIFSGISKKYAATGLRIGHAIGPSSLIEGMAKIQSQTTSGANSLIQRALVEIDDNYEQSLKDIKIYLRSCSQCLMDKLREYDLAKCWYQTQSAFYFMLDFSRTPYFIENYGKLETKDYSQKICEEILEKVGVAIVPGSAFGLDNSARISLTLEIKFFEEAVDRLCQFLARRV